MIFSRYSIFTRRLKVESPCLNTNKKCDFTLCGGSTIVKFLNEYLLFSEEFREIFSENVTKIETSGYLVFSKRFPAAGDTIKISMKLYRQNC